MTLVQSPITANWVTKQMNSHTRFVLQKTPLLAVWILNLKKTLKSLYLLIFEDVFEALLNVTNWLISSTKQKPVCCWTGKMNEIRDLGLFAREALALFGMDEVKLLGDLSRVERGCQTLFEGSFKARATAKTEEEFYTHFKAIISRRGSSEARTEQTLALMVNWHYHY